MRPVTWNGDASSPIGQMDLPAYVVEAIKSDATVLLVGCTTDASTGEVLSFDLVPMPVVANHG